MALERKADFNIAIPSDILQGWYEFIFRIRAQLQGLSREQKAELFKSNDISGKVYRRIRHDLETTRLRRHSDLHQLCNQIKNSLVDLIDQWPNYLIEEILQEFCEESLRKGTGLTLWVSFREYIANLQAELKAMGADATCLAKSDDAWAKAFKHVTNTVDYSLETNATVVTNKKTYLPIICVLSGFYIIYQLLTNRENLIPAATLFLISWIFGEKELPPINLNSSPEFQTLIGNTIAEFVAQLKEEKAYTAPGTAPLSPAVNQFSLFALTEEAPSRQPKRWRELSDTKEDVKSKTTEKKDCDYVNEVTGDTYVRMELPGLFTRFNRKQLKEDKIIRTYEATDHVMSKIESALLTRRVNASSKCKKTGMTAVAKEEKFGEPWKLRIPHDVRVKYAKRAAATQFELEHPEIQEVFSPRGARLHGP